MVLIWWFVFVKAYKVKFHKSLSSMAIVPQRQHYMFYLKRIFTCSKDIQTSFCLRSSCLLWNGYWGQDRNQELSKHSSFYSITCFPVNIFCLLFQMSLYRTYSAYQNCDTKTLRAESPWQWFIYCLQIHIRIKKYICPQCNKSFNEKNCLNYLKPPLSAMKPKHLWSKVSGRGLLQFLLIFFVLMRKCQVLMFVKGKVTCNYISNSHDLY